MALCGDGTLPAAEAQPEHGATLASRAATAPRGGTPRQRRGSSEAAGAAEAAGESLDLKLEARWHVSRRCDASPRPFRGMSTTRPLARVA